MASCKCSPSLERLMGDFAKLGHVNSGCCAGAAHHQANPKSDHEPNLSGYAHAQDIHEKRDHDMQPFVNFIMANPSRFPQVKYLIYERYIYYPSKGARPPGRYHYTGPNAHAAHLHVSIHSWATFYAGSWYVFEAYNSTDSQEDDDVYLFYEKNTGGADNGQVFLIHGGGVTYIASPADLGVLERIVPESRRARGLTADLIEAMNQLAVNT